MSHNMLYNIGFLHEKKKVTGFRMIDAARIKVSLKCEFNTSNIEIYRKENIVREWSVEPLHNKL